MTRTILRAGIAIVLLGCLVTGASAAAAERDVTFISTSDSHFRPEKDSRNVVADIDTVRGINSVTDISWPDSLGGGMVSAPRGVLLLGDIIDDGDMARDGVPITEQEYANFKWVFGLDGKDGLLKYPVFETWGNHDGSPAGKEKGSFSVQGHIKERNQLRKQKGFIQNISESGMHYSWDWDDVHFVSLGIYAADKQHDGIRHSPQWHDPQGALAFLKADLEKNVGDSGRPVVLMSHMGFDTGWWIDEDWADLYTAVKKYNVIAYLFGHTGTGVWDWAPAGETKKWLCINDGQTTNGFFVVQIKGNDLRFGYRSKKWSAAYKPTGEAEQSIWNGEWEWTLTRKVSIPGGK